MTFKKKVIVALDSNNFVKIEEIINSIKDHVFGFKLGYEFFFNFGLDGYSKIHDKNIKIFLDLKLHDIPNTIKHGILAISRMCPYFTSVHISGGDEMLKQAINNKGETKILGISILTSLDNNQVNKYYSRKNIETLLNDFIYYALENNLDGIVCSPHEIKKVKEIAKDKLIIVTPGIRPLHYTKQDDQKRFMSAKKATSLGANFIVIGRPITEAANPLQEIKKINLEIKK